MALFGLVSELVCSLIAALLCALAFMHKVAGALAIAIGVGLVGLFISFVGFDYRDVKSRIQIGNQVTGV